MKHEYKRVMSILEKTNKQTKNKQTNNSNNNNNNNSNNNNNNNNNNKPKKHDESKAWSNDWFEIKQDGRELSVFFFCLLACSSVCLSACLALSLCSQ